MKIDIDFKITESAARELVRMRSELEFGTGDEFVRVAVGGGCSGKRNDMLFVGKDQVDPSSDFVEDFWGIGVVVDKKSLLKLDGAIIDWVEDGERSGFKFSAPSSCGGGCCRK